MYTGHQQREVVHFSRYVTSFDILEIEDLEQIFAKFERTVRFTPMISPVAKLRQPVGTQTIEPQSLLLAVC